MAGAKDFDEAYEAMKADSQLQFELPEPEPVKPSNTPDWLEALFAFLGSILEILFYAGIAIVVAIILYYLLKEVIRSRFLLKKRADPAEDEPPPLYAPDTQEARILLEDVDKLAAQGKFAEAVHTLLFRSIQDIDINRPNTIRQSLTSREIAALDILTQETRDAFSKIGSVVENSFFGGRSLERSDFESCRAAYAALTAPKAWS